MLKILEVHKVFNATPYPGAFKDLCLRYDVLSSCKIEHLPINILLCFRIPIRDLSFAPDKKRRRRKRQVKTRHGV